MKKLILIAVTIILCASNAVYASTAQDADSAYAQRDYAAALSGYRKALDNDGTSSDLYYNLANTYYRLGNIGQAVLCYERALKINPANDDASANLQFVRSQIQGSPEDDSTFLSKMHQSIKSGMSPDAWAWVAFVVFVLVCAAVALYLFSNSIYLRKLGFFSAIVFLAAFIYTLTIAYQTANAISDNSYAIVTSPVTNLRSEPTSDANKNAKTVPLPAGSKVEIVDSLSTPKDKQVPMWYEVKINNNSRAWMNAADAERI